MAFVISERLLDTPDEIFSGTVAKGDPTVYGAGSSIAIGNRDLQVTYSYRTEAKPEEGSAEDYETWTDVSRFGFRQFTSMYDRGHEFWTYSRRVSGKENRTIRVPYSSSYDYYFKGPAVFSGPDGQESYPVPMIERMTQEIITAEGQRLLLKASPITPEASLGAFVGELLESLPAFIGVGAMREGANMYRGLGSEYLNVQFGWKPFISEVQKLMKVVSTSTKRLAQLQRDSGRVVRRKFWESERAPEINLTEYSPYPTHLRGMNKTNATTLFGFTDSSKPATVYTRASEKYGFAGAMTYYTDIGNGVLDNMVEFQRKADALLGATLNPTVLWELAPWSWLVDWVSNVGDSIAISDQLGNGLVLRYGYLMRETRVDTLLQSPLLTYRPISGRPGSGGETFQLSNLHQQVMKERVRATPFGFALQVDDFSATQWAILAALGMTRAPKVLDYSRWA
jgi:hypothetical protein